MARLSVRATDNGPWQALDPVHVLRDEEEHGKLVNLAGGFYRVQFPDLSYEAALALKEPGSNAARKFKIEIDAIERRAGDRHVRVTGEISRLWSEVSAVAINNKTP